MKLLYALIVVLAVGAAVADIAVRRPVYEDVRGDTSDVMVLIDRMQALGATLRRRINSGWHPDWSPLDKLILHSALDLLATCSTEGDEYPAHLVMLAEEIPWLRCSVSRSEIAEIKRVEDLVELASEIPGRAAGCLAAK